MCIGGDEYMRTNIVIDDDLMQQAMKLSGLKTKRQVVEEGLKRLVQMGHKKDLLKLAGKIEFLDDYNYKDMRKSRSEKK